MNKNLWEKFAPWFLSICSIAAIVLLSYFVLNNIEWIKTNSLNGTNAGDPKYCISIILIFTSMIKRTIGLFSSLCLIFIGMGISAYVMSKQIKLEMKDMKWSISLVTASPGIIAMVLGVILMISDINSKDTFNYSDVGSNQAQSTGLERTYQFDK